MAQVRNFESNEDKLNRLTNEHLEKCDELDKTLNQMELKYKYRKPAADGLIKGELNDVDNVFAMMAGIRTSHKKIDAQKEKMGIKLNKTANEKILEETIDENLL